jgi:hypothetical protein
MRNVKTYTEFINEAVQKIPMGEVRGNELRINGVKNKMYIVNFDSNMTPPEKKSFLKYIKEKHGSIITEISTHLGDLVITLSVFVTTPLANDIKEILNSIFTQRAEDNQEKAEREDSEKDPDPD